MVVPIKHTELIISRPILTGAEDLASVLEVKSFGIFGLTDTDGVFISMSYNSGEQRRVAQKRFRCYRKLLLPLVELATPTSSQPNSPLYYAAHRLQQRLAVVSNSNNNDFPSQLMRVGLSHDVVPDQDIVIRSKCLGVRTMIHKPGQELILMPEQPYQNLFVDEHQFFIGALKSIGRVRDNADILLSAPYQPVVPLGQLPSDARPEEITELCNELKPYLPVRMVVGSILPPMVR